MIVLLEEVIQWWLILFIIGILTLPITTRIFGLFFDKGYAFSKTIGLICITYVTYVLGTVHLLPFTTISVICIEILLAGIFIFVTRKDNLAALFQKSWKIFIFEEIVFFVCLFFWSYIKGFQPDIHGLEKFMDYGFLNSLLRTTYFPAKDMWMAPLSINYYYFGHLETAVLTRLSLLPSNITFNLMLASIFAFTFTGGFSLGANLIYLLKRAAGVASKRLAPLEDVVSSGEPQRTILGGFVSAFLLTFGGNLHTIYTFFTPYQNDTPVPPTHLAFSPQTFPNSYWYPNATRFIYHTIHEFPIYSFVVSDLHGHVLDIPLVLLMLAILLIIFLTPLENFKMRIGSSLLLGSIAGIMYMTNAWDGLIYIGFAAVLLFYKFFSKGFLETLLSQKFLISVGGLFMSFVVISLPFSIFFKPFASQIGLNCAPEFLLRLGNIGPILFERGYCQHSPLWQLAILYGFFFFWFVGFITFLFREYRKKGKYNPIDLFVASLGFLGFALICVPEFVYLKDIYTTYFRANTMFKLVYQSFILLSLVSGYTMYRIFSEIKVSKKSFIKRFFSVIFFIFSFILITLVMIYPYFAILSYFDNLKNFHGLDGTTYLQSISSDDYKAVQWLNLHIQGQPVVLEAQGDSYTDYERISSNTGLPTVFGWMVHEWLWRGTYDIVPGRVADVTSLYESKSIEETKSLLKKYEVQYVYIGDMERTKYPEIDQEKFDQLGKIIYASGSVKIYKIL